MAVCSAKRVEQVERIGDDRIEQAIHRSQQIALPRRHLLQTGQGGVDARQAQRGGIDGGHERLGTGVQRAAPTKHAACFLLYFTVATRSAFVVPA